MAVIVPILSTFNAAGIKAATGALGALGASLKRVGLAAGAAAVGFKAFGATVDFVTESITAARDLQRNLFAMETVFGSLNPQMVEFTKNAANMGISQVDAARTATYLGAILKQSGFSMEETGVQTQRLTVLAQDLATTYGKDVGEALTAITAMFRGEYDPIEKFGVALKQNEVNSFLAAKGLGKLEGQALLNAQTQVKLEQLFIRTTDAQGAFAAQSNTLYGSQTRLNATFENLKATLGERLLPVINDFANSLIPLVEDLAPEGDKAFKGLADVMESLEPLLKPLASIFGTLTGSVGTLFSALSPLISFLADVVAVVLEFIADMLLHVASGVEQAIDLFNDLGAIVNNQFGTGVTDWIRDFINGSNILRPLIGWLVDRLALIGTDSNRSAKAETDRLTAQAVAYQKSQAAKKSGTSFEAPETKPKKTVSDAAKKAADAFQASLKASKEAAEKARKAYEDLKSAIDEFNKGFADTLTGFKQMFAFSTPLGEFEQQTVEAFQNITDAAKEAFEKGLISPKVLADLQAYADKEKTILVGIAKQRDVLQKKISIAQSITSGVMGSLNLTSMLETETSKVTKSVTKMVDGIAVTTTQTFDEVVSGGLAGSFKKLVDKTKAFAGNLTQLKKLGLNGNLFKQIVDAGAEGGNATAEAIIAGGAEAVQELNGLFGELTTAGSDIASTATDVMYGLGEDVTNSFIDGLRAQDQALINAAQSLANTFANSFNARLGSAMNVNLTGTQVTAGLSMDSTDYIRGRGRVNASGLAPSGQPVINVTVQANTITDQASLPQVIVDGLGTYVRQSGAGGLTRLLGL